MNGSQLIAAERIRQTTEEGWTIDHDDTHLDGALCAAAAHVIESVANIDVTSDHWYDHDWIQKLYAKSRDRNDTIRSLVIAGALIAAEIDRLHRASSAIAMAVFEALRRNLTALAEWCDAQVGVLD